MNIREGLKKLKRWPQYFVTKLKVKWEKVIKTRLRLPARIGRLPLPGLIFYSHLRKQRGRIVFWSIFFLLVSVAVIIIALRGQELSFKLSPLTEKRVLGIIIVTVLWFLGFERIKEKISLWWKERTTKFDEIFKRLGIILAGLVFIHLGVGILFNDFYQRWIGDLKWFLVGNLLFLTIPAFWMSKNEEGKSSVAGKVVAIILSGILLTYFLKGQEAKQVVKTVNQVVEASDIYLGPFSVTAPPKNDSGEWEKIKITKGSYWTLASLGGMRIRSKGKVVTFPPQERIFGNLSRCVFPDPNDDDFYGWPSGLGSAVDGDLFLELQSPTDRPQEVRGCVKAR